MSMLVADPDNERMTPTRERYGEDFCVIEHECTRRTAPSAASGCGSTAAPSLRSSRRPSSGPDAGAGCCPGQDSAAGWASAVSTPVIPSIAVRAASAKGVGRTPNVLSIWLSLTTRSPCRPSMSGSSSS